MGGEFDSRTYEGVHTKDEIQELFYSDSQEAISVNGCEYSGTIAQHSYDKIQWSEKIVHTEQEAKSVISEEQKSKWDPIVGVFYNADDKEGCVVGGWCSA